MAQATPNSQPGGPRPEVKVVRDTGDYRGQQGLNYFTGISRESASAQGLCMHLLTIPPGGRAKAHLHAYHETAIYVLSGEAKMWYGENLKELLVVRAGDFLYIPSNTPHLPMNPTDEPCSALVARTDPNEQESVVLLPELDAMIAAALGER
jgi:uncharacterized RmlC-like cupin family protein